MTVNPDRTSDVTAVLASDDTTYDALVVGGGAAGLAGAVALARARRRVLVVDSGEPRNAPADGVHNYLGREGTPPGELLAAGRDELAAYGGRVLSGRAVAAREVSADPRLFEVRLEDGAVLSARRLLITTGLADELPDVPGLGERWGRDVLHCPYCHGYEVRDQAVGILATGPFAGHQAQLFRQLTDDVTLFRHTWSGPEDEEWEQLAARGIAVVEGEVTGLEVTDDRLAGVRLADGHVIARDALVVSPRFAARSSLLETLGLKAVEQEMNGWVFGSAVPADPTGATEIPGVWVAGNVTNLQAQVVTAAAGGLMAGARLNADLIEEEVRAAVASR